MPHRTDLDTEHLDDEDDDNEVDESDSDLNEEIDEIMHDVFGTDQEILSDSDREYRHDIESETDDL